MIFVLQSILLGVGLAMDAFSVSMANGLRDPGMHRRRQVLVAGTFAGFQFLMPMAGWAGVRAAAERFRALQACIPWIAFLLLAWIGGKMVLEGCGKAGGEEGKPGRDARGAPLHVLSAGELVLQGIATSIDALSVGFTIAEYALPRALLCSALVAATTFAICMAGVRIGRLFGMRLAGRADILGGAILVAIGCKILLGGGF